jgi:hypothetical protein
MIRAFVTLSRRGRPQSENSADPAHRRRLSRFAPRSSRRLAKRADLARLVHDGCFPAADKEFAMPIPIPRPDRDPIPLVPAVPVVPSQFGRLVPLDY